MQYPNFVGRHLRYLVAIFDCARIFLTIKLNFITSGLCLTIGYHEKIMGGRGPKAISLWVTNTSDFHFIELVLSSTWCFGLLLDLIDTLNDVLCCLYHWLPNWVQLLPLGNYYFNSLPQFWTIVVLTLHVGSLSQ